MIHFKLILHHFLKLWQVEISENRVRFLHGLMINRATDALELAARPINSA
jgi:hypothetical protein